MEAFQCHGTETVLFFSIFIMNYKQHTCTADNINILTLTLINIPKWPSQSELIPYINLPNKAPSPLTTQESQGCQHGPTKESKQGTTTRQGGRKKAHFLPSLGWSHRGTGWLCSRTRRSMSMQHVQYGWLKQCILKCHCALDDLVWISSSLAEPELARATRSLRLQNPSPTSHLPKHEAGVILLSPCKSVLWMMKQKNLARVKEREMPLLFATCREHEENTGVGGDPASPPLPV